MFSNKNNKLKFQNGGDANPPFNEPPANPQFNQPPANPPFNEPPANPQFNEPPANAPFNEPPANAPFNEPPANAPGMFSSNENYPNTDYLYDKITSQENQNNIKTYICAFTINKELDTHFVKYIVQQKDLIVSLPFFKFTSEQQNTMQGIMQGTMQGAPIQEQQNLMQGAPVQGQQNIMQGAPVQGQQNIMQGSMQGAPVQGPIQGPIQEQQNLIQGTMQGAPMPAAPMQGPIQGAPMQGPIQGAPMQGPMQGGFKDNSDEEKDLDKMFKTKTIEFVKSIYQNASEPSYIGYIPNISETDAVFVFVRIETPGQLNSEFIECIPNELVFLSKVYNFDIDQPIKDLFANNTWLYMKQSLASPFSGYLCKQNEQNQLVNVSNEEIANLYDQYLINIDGMGNHYYFSFLPLDTGTYARFALFPVEYDCILDNSQLEYYKQNINTFVESDSIYFKDVLKDGQQFFALKTPTQFTKI